MHKAQLLPGEYTLRLLFADPESTAAGQRVFTVAVSGMTNAVDIFKEAGGANRLLERDVPVTLRSPDEVAVTLTPVKGKVAISGLVLERAE